jgi:hypothetical protein
MIIIQYCNEEFNGLKDFVDFTVSRHRKLRKMYYSRISPQETLKVGYGILVMENIRKKKLQIKFITILEITR